MKKLVRVVLILAVVIGAVGFYRGWFTVSTSQTAGSNKVDVNVTVDPYKAKADAQKVSPLN